MSSSPATDVIRIDIPEAAAGTGRDAMGRITGDTPVGDVMANITRLTGILKGIYSQGAVTGDVAAELRTNRQVQRTTTQLLGNMGILTRMGTGGQIAATMTEGANSIFSDWGRKLLTERMGSGFVKALDEAPAGMRGFLNVTDWYRKRQADLNYTKSFRQYMEDDAEQNDLKFMALSRRTWRTRMFGGRRDREIPPDELDDSDVDTLVEQERTAPRAPKLRHISQAGRDADRGGEPPDDDDGEERDGRGRGRGRGPRAPGIIGAIGGMMGPWGQVGAVGLTAALGAMTYMLPNLLRVLPAMVSGTNKAIGEWAERKAVESDYSTRYGKALEMSQKMRSTGLLGYVEELGEEANTTRQAQMGPLATLLSATLDAEGKKRGQAAMRMSAAGREARNLAGVGGLHGNRDEADTVQEDWNSANRDVREAGQWDRGTSRQGQPSSTRSAKERFTDRANARLNSLVQESRDQDSRPPVVTPANAASMYRN